MSDAFCRYVVGDSLDVMRAMPAGSVDLVLTSPPFLALRSYLPADHPAKGREMGSEPTPGAYIDNLLAIVEECRRVLAPHGSLCLELGDTYAGSGGAGGDYGENGLREGQPKFRARPGLNRSNPDAHHPGWPLPKSLCLIPELLRVSMVYGFNPLTGRQTPRWRARNVVRWVRPNPPVGALGDKFRPATTEMVTACEGKRYFDLDAVREASHDTRPRNTNGPKNADADSATVLGHYATRTTNPAGAPPLDWWEIPTEPYPGAHYATWPRALCVRPIEAMTPRRVCEVCGNPSERIVEASERYGAAMGKSIRSANDNGRAVSKDRNSLQPKGMVAAEYQTLGWTDCGHGAWRPGVVLDCFAGSGTTLAVAQGHGRSAIGIDLDPRNADLAQQRVGMWLEVTEHTEPAA